MSYFKEVYDAWLEEMNYLDSSLWFQKLKKGDLSLEHYKAYLRETYFYTSINPQIQAVATIYFKDNPRDMVKKFYKHAISEIGHDLLALNDLQALGEDIEEIKKMRPLPATVALNAFPLFQMQYRSPLSYLGYLFHLEFMPTLNGRKYIEILKNMGIPDSALTFLEEHAEVDIAHNKLMESYIDYFIKTPEDKSEVIYAAKATCVLHGRVITDAFESINKG